MAQTSHVTEAQDDEHQQSGNSDPGKQTLAARSARTIVGDSPVGNKFVFGEMTKGFSRDGQCVLGDPFDTRSSPKANDRYLRAVAAHPA